jgi:hypothetical protein
MGRQNARKNRGLSRKSIITIITWIFMEEQCQSHRLSLQKMRECKFSRMKGRVICAFVQTKEDTNCVCNIVMDWEDSKSSSSRA